MSEQINPLEILSQEQIDEMNKQLEEAENEICPVCGYYCLGEGGRACIDKPGYVEKHTQSLSTKRGI